MKHLRCRPHANRCLVSPSGSACPSPSHPLVPAPCGTGGLRSRNKALTCNDGWENDSFRGWAAKRAGAGGLPPAVPCFSMRAPCMRGLDASVEAAPTARLRRHLSAACRTHARFLSLTPPSPAAMQTTCRPRRFSRGWSSCWRRHVPPRAARACAAQRPSTVRATAGCHAAAAQVAACKPVAAGRSSLISASLACSLPHVQGTATACCSATRSPCAAAACCTSCSAVRHPLPSGRGALVCCLRLRAGQPAALLLMHTCPRYPRAGKAPLPH